MMLPLNRRESHLFEAMTVAFSGANKLLYHLDSSTIPHTRRLHQCLSSRSDHLRHRAQDLEDLQSILYFDPSKVVELQDAKSQCGRRFNFLIHALGEPPFLHLQPFLLSLQQHLPQENFALVLENRKCSFGGQEVKIIRQ